MDGSRYYDEGPTNYCHKCFDEYCGSDRQTFRLTKPVMPAIVYYKLKKRGANKWQQEQE